MRIQDITGSGAVINYTNIGSKVQVFFSRLVVSESIGSKLERSFIFTSAIKLLMHSDIFVFTDKETPLDIVHFATGNESEDIYYDEYGAASSRDILRRLQVTHQLNNPVMGNIERYIEQFGDKSLSIDYVDHRLIIDVATQLAEALSLPQHARP
jgi:hypothetical protein